MNKCFFNTAVYSMLLVLLAACNIPEAQTEIPTLPTKTPTETIIEPSPTPEEPELIVTQLTIDGDPSDWADYEVLITDPEGDHQDGGFDIAAVRAFANDQYLYVLTETHEPSTDYMQVDLDIEAGERHFIVTFNPVENSSAVMGEIISNQFNPVGEVAGSSSAAAQAVEFKVPLSALGDAVDLTLRDVRPMGGECCDENWYAIDNIKSIIVAKLDETEPVSEASTAPQVCAAEISLPAPFGSLQPALVELAEPGYTAEWFVAPGAFNMPQDVLLTPQGNILVLASRNFALFEVMSNGSITTYADGVYGYTSDIDNNGNAYLYSHPDGRIYQVTPDGIQSILAEDQNLVTDCTSGIGVGPDGNLYTARNLCDKGFMDKADLYRITLGGQVERVAEEIPALMALKTDANGRLIAAALGNAIYELILDDFLFTQIGNLPGHDGSAVNGLTSDEAGNLYISTGTWSSSGQVYRLDANGDFSLVADIPGNGLSGIEWNSNTGEILGVQLQRGTLIAVSDDGSLREVVPGNGLTTPRGLAFSPCGELAVSNEDAGMMALIDPSGTVFPYFEYNSFTSPVSFMWFDKDGKLYITEGAPGLTERVITVSPGDFRPVPLLDIARPCGIVQLDDGSLIVAETIHDRIVRISSDGSLTVFIDGVTRPSALALGADDYLYVVTGTAGRPLDEVHMPDSGDTIIRLSPEGTATEFAAWSKLTGLAFAPSGDLYAATGWDGEIVKISPDGRVAPFVSGLKEITDLAFDLAGNLYASDTVLNGIIRFDGFPQGTLTGTVTDASGLPVERARVQVLASNPIVIGQIVLTDVSGHFSLPAAPRNYDIIVTVDGYETETLANIDVVANQEIVIEIELGG